MQSISLLNRNAYEQRNIRETSDMESVLKRKKPTHIIFDSRFHTRTQGPPRFDPVSDRLIAKNYVEPTVKLQEKANGKEDCLSFSKLIDRDERRESQR